METEPLVINFPTEGGLLFKSVDAGVHFELRKTISEPVAFKVLSKFPKIYRVHPNFGVIEGPVGRTKSVSVVIDVSQVSTQKEITGLANDVLLIDTVRVNDVQNDAPAPKKANKSVQAFDWSKVEDRSLIATMRLRSKIDHALKAKLLKEVAEKEEKHKEVEKVATEEEQNKAESDLISKESQSEEKETTVEDVVVADPKPLEEAAVMMECENGEPNQQQVGDENATYMEVTTGEMTLVSEPSESDKFPAKLPAPDLANFMNEIRQIEAKAVPANRAIRVLRTNASEKRLPPLFGIIAKVFTAAQYRNAVRHGEPFIDIDD